MSSCPNLIRGNEDYFLLNLGERLTFISQFIFLKSSFSNGLTVLCNVTGCCCSSFHARLALPERLQQALRGEGTAALRPVFLVRRGTLALLWDPPFSGLALTAIWLC